MHSLGVRCGGCRGTGVVGDAEDAPDGRSLFDRMIAKKVDLEEAISGVRGLPAEVKRRWNDCLEAISVTQPDAEAVLVRLRGEVDEAERDYPLCELAVIYCDLGELARMCAEYRTREG
jgi:hypothetical protein